MSHRDALATQATQAMWWAWEPVLFMLVRALRSLAQPTLLVRVFQGAVVATLASQGLCRPRPPAHITPPLAQECPVPSILMELTFPVAALAMLAMQEQCQQQQPVLSTLAHAQQWPAQRTQMESSFH